MKSLTGMVFASLFLAGTVLAAEPKTYQVTGPVLDVTDNVITVEKDKDKWELARDKDTKISGDLKKGSRVTVRYKMIATNVEVKDAPKAKSDTKGASPAKKNDSKTK